MKTRIKDLRLEKRISQQALAENLSLNQSMLSKIECEISIPDAMLVSHISRFFHVSTDYVFDGNGTRPYLETDPTGPQGAYGRTKLAGENFVREFSNRHYIIRTAWLYGDGKNFVKTMLRLSETNDKVRVVMDQVGSPTSADELAKAIAYLLPTENYGLFHGTCEGDCSWAQFTEEIFRLAGRNTIVEAITSEEYAAAAKRPAYSILENYMFKMTTDFMFADWHDAIAEYIGRL